MNEFSISSAINLDAEGFVAFLSMNFALTLLLRFAFSSNLNFYVCLYFPSRVAIGAGIN